MVYLKIVFVELIYLQNNNNQWIVQPSFFITLVILKESAMTFLRFDKAKLINLEYSLKRELIRTNRAGSYACTTIIDCNTRKYHGLLICPLPYLDGGRHVLLSSLHETLIYHEKEFNLGMHKYAGDHYEPKGHKYITDFSTNPIPKLIYQVGGLVLSKEKLLAENESQMIIKYTLEEASSAITLRFRPFLAFRNIHALSKANMDVNTKYQEVKNGIASRLYNGYPDLYMQFSKKAEFIPAPDWYYNVEYLEDQKRGYEYKEDLFVPGYFELSVKKGESILFSVGISEISPTSLKQKFAKELSKRIPRNDFDNCLLNTVMQFFIYDNDNVFIIAGYPWLPIRTRDMLISLPGLSIALNDSQLFKKVLHSVFSEMEGHLLPDLIHEKLPKRYPADIPLWITWCLQQLELSFPKENVWKLYGNYINTIIEGYLDEKNLFQITEKGLIYVDRLVPNNSWMNGESNFQPVLQRKGYKVETNALWYNTIAYALSHSNKIADKNWVQKLEELKQKIEVTFSEVFWDEHNGYLVDYVSDTEINKQIRPNQIFAASLPFSPLSKVQIKSILDVVKLQLLTPFGIRSLSPEDTDYEAKYKGNHEEREKAAFNGSVWPWLFTHYYDASMKVNPKSIITTGQRLIQIFESEVQFDGICSISELYHADPPQKAKGAISFAMNTGELIRLKSLLEKEI